MRPVPTIHASIMRDVATRVGQVCWSMSFDATFIHIYDQDTYIKGGALVPGESMRHADRVRVGDFSIRTASPGFPEANPAMNVRI